MRETIREVILGTVKDLYHSGLVDETTVARMDTNYQYQMYTSKNEKKLYD